MPGKDGTGPNGKGPKSGRGLGPCKGDPLNTCPITPRGGGRRRGPPKVVKRGVGGK